LQALAFLALLEAFRFFLQALLRFAFELAA
jgi:hypothetical protein